jgi:hypothetical protein
MVMDTEVITLKINRPAADRPCLVITTFRLNTPQIKIGSPGLKKLNTAGMAMKRENKGMKIQVLLRKNHRLIPEKKVNAKTDRYITAIRWGFLVKSTARSKRRQEIVFMRASLLCKKAFFAAYSSAKTDSLKKDRAPLIECSMNIFLDNY